MNIVFEVTGGLGKNIIATVMVKLLRQKYPKHHFVVVSSSPEVFHHNPHIDVLLTPDRRGEIYHLINPKTKVFLHEPYYSSNFITKKESIYNTWAKLCGVEYNGEQPEIFITKEEEEKYTKLFDTSKPILVLHPHGGPVIEPTTNPKNYPNNGYNWVRDIPRNVSKEIINYYKNDYNIYQVKHPLQKITLSGVNIAYNPIREIMVLLKISSKRILIDSFSQHLAAALNLESTVLWIGTSTKNFGYELHNNIKANPYTQYPHYTTYVGFDLAEPMNYMPYKNTLEIFNIDKILK